MLNIYLIRHAQSYANANMLDLIGQPDDTPITDLGIRQTELLANNFIKENIQFNIIYSSIYKRAWQTAKILQEKLNHKNDIRYSDALVEYDFGDFKGQKRIDVLNKFALPMAHLNMGFPVSMGRLYIRRRDGLQFGWRIRLSITTSYMKLIMQTLQ